MNAVLSPPMDPGMRAVPRPGGVVSSGGSSTTRMLRLVLDYNLAPHKTVHPSWWPAHWPAAYRRADRFGEAGQQVLLDLLVRGACGSPLQAAFDADFDAPVKRLALMDTPSLRQLAAICGFAVHRNLFRQWGWSPQVWRQARRWSADLPEFIEDRTPRLGAFNMNVQQVPMGSPAIGRVMLARGQRLLMAMLRAQDPVLVQRLQLRFPKHRAMQTVPVLTPIQLQQLQELVLCCVIPERFPQWDWLF